MMQQLLTTSRQLTLGAYKHETECTNTRYTPSTNAQAHAHTHTHTHTHIHTPLHAKAALYAHSI